MDPKGRIALITGGARVGRAVAERLAERGADVAITFRSSRAAAEETAAAVRARGPRALLVEADLARPEAAESAVDQVRSGLGGLDILVCMASVYRKTPLAALDDRAWRENLESDLGSVYRLALQAAPVMQSRGGGRIVAFADWLPASGRPRYKGYLPYYVAKAGVIGLIESLALELAPSILVNSVAPGPILAPPGMGDEEQREVMRATPLGRWGGPEEIARAVLFLIETEFVTGECLRVDGGRHLN
ncbi:MAG TPA: SDR family oxidoreductase [Patescibacteria group bacterium]|nr:SDR family oxidoreductase [Patescibacteria group bacterium]